MYEWKQSKAGLKTNHRTVCKPLMMPDIPDSERAEGDMAYLALTLLYFIHNYMTLVPDG